MGYFMTLVFEHNPVFTGISKLTVTKLSYFELNQSPHQSCQSNTNKYKSITFEVTKFSKAIFDQLPSSMKTFFTCLFVICPLIIIAQNSYPDSLSVPEKKPSVNYFGIRFGGLASSFSHNPDLLVPAPGKNSLPAWHAGLAMDLFTKKYYNARIELSYLSKGARETFTNDRIAIQSTNRLQYIEISALPLIIKPGFKKINPYLALGGYYARRVGIKSRSKTGAGSWEKDQVTADNLNVTNDYGYSVSAGIYVWKRPVFELRYEAGLRSVSSTSNIKNRSVILSISI